MNDVQTDDEMDLQLRLVHKNLSAHVPAGGHLFGSMQRDDILCNITVQHLGRATIALPVVSTNGQATCDRAVSGFDDEVCSPPNGERGGSKPGSCLPALILIMRRRGPTYHAEFLEELEDTYSRSTINRCLNRLVNAKMAVHAKKNGPYLLSSDE